MALPRAYLKWLFVVAAASMTCFVAAADDSSAKPAPVPATNAVPAKQQTPAVSNTTGSTNQAGTARPFFKEWKVDELVPIVNKALKSKRSFEKGQKLFADLSCSVCHHFGQDGTGGVGPDLTGASGTFSVHDLLENIIEPSKEISSLYVTTIVLKKDGETVTGWIPEENDVSVSVMENMLSSGNLTVVPRKEIESMMPSKVSLMPEGLLNALKEEQIADLVAYLLSGGDATQKIFR